MMWQWLLERVMNYIIGKDVFGQIKISVEKNANNTKLTGQQKKDAVLDDLKEIGKEFASHMLNLGIEAAVAMMKSKIESK